MRKLLAVVFVTLFAASTGAFAAGHMKGEKDAKAEKTSANASKKADPKKASAKKASAKKASAKKASAKKGEDKK